MAAFATYRPPPSDSSGDAPSSSPPSSTVLKITESPPPDTPTTSSTEYETICWGCGLRLILPSHSPIFKCGWCGAITNQNACRYESEGFSWRRFRDRSFLCILLTFMSFMICGGLWAVYPTLFSVGYFFGIFNCMVTAILSITTISTLSLAAFRNAGTPPLIVWGSYPAVEKGDLDNYTFCQYCSKPKSPRAHHCRTCGMCILDMDHHCPFIGNCVGAANHRHFIYFLSSAVISMVYVTIMSAYASYHTLPPSSHRVAHELLRPGNSNNIPGFFILRAIFLSLLSSATLLSTRGLVLVYLFISSLSVEIGLGVLLWQQLCFIYEGKTYLSSLNSQEGDQERDCRNFSRFFGWPYFTSRYLTSLSNPRKIHER